MGNLDGTIFVKVVAITPEDSIQAGTNLLPVFRSTDFCAHAVSAVRTCIAGGLPSFKTHPWNVSKTDVYNGPNIGVVPAFRVGCTKRFVGRGMQIESVKCVNQSDPSNRWFELTVDG